MCALYYTCICVVYKMDTKFPSVPLKQSLTSCEMGLQGQEMKWMHLWEDLASKLILIL